ncbi:MAG: glycosyltransferase family 2 protein [Bacteroidetes bacterium]|nr:glycosyltransferase family 2 protein [Bacteroidota bacterium]
MKYLEILFWFLVFIVFYAYIGYGILLIFLVKIKSIFVKDKNLYSKDYEPEVTLLIAAFNEKDYVAAKVRNSLQLDYPKNKLHLVWVTDGSDDGTPELLGNYPEVTVYHESARNGKIGAINRAMKFVNTPIVVYSDANTMLGEDAIRRIIYLFSNSEIGCVSGEKRIVSKDADAASGAGEGIYWKYESLLKRYDFRLYSVVGAAGELFAVRTELHQDVERDTILDDFIISLRIAMKGYKIGYDPDAYAIESASANVKEELKRKIRIAAGGIQSIVRLKALLNPFKYRTLTFQYISHRVLRWTLAPLSLILIFIMNAFFAFKQGFDNSNFYTLLFCLQLLFYFSALLGWFLQNREIKVKLLFIPYYFFIMNYAVVLGFFRYIKRSQSVNWERAKRAN